jgi:HSP20 family protein
MNDVRLPDLFDFETLRPSLREFWRPWRVEGADTTAPQIRLDVSESDGNYLVKAEIPGVKKEDIDVRVDGRQVTIAAEVKQDNEDKQDGRVLRAERRYGYASRSFLLDAEVDQAAADAKYSNGVLELRLPKKAQSAGKRVTVG